MGEAATQLTLISKSGKDSCSVRDYIYKRQTPEIIIAFCGAVGSGVSTVAKELQNQMTRSNYNYKVEYIKVSEIISTLASVVKSPVDDLWYSEFSVKGKRIGHLQENGNALRKDYSHDILAQFIIGKINQIRADRHLSNDGRIKLLDGEDPVEPLRIVWIIDSLKNPEEVETLRAVYGSMFYLIGVLCPEDKRTARLINKDITATEANLIIDKDKSEPDKFGQQLIDTIHKSDYFISNSYENTDPVKISIQRCIEILFGEIKTPTKEEYAMFVAQSAAYNSACLSRQVGAAIADTNGIIISYGCNDVPKYGGGLYCTEDGCNDNRCYKTFDIACRSTKEKDRIKIIIKGIIDGKVSDGIDTEELLELIIKQSGIKNLTEYSKAVHAEMDAIIKMVRSEKSIPKGSTMFVTTYPCHNCAKHIVASGITTVYYIEPYEKSLASKLHSDSITLDPEKTENKVRFIPFDGVAPRQFQKFFKMHGDRKGAADVSLETLQSKIPISEKFLDTYGFYEGKVLESLKEMELSSMLHASLKGGGESEEKRPGKGK